MVAAGCSTLSRSRRSTDPVAIISVLNFTIVPSDFVVRLFQIGDEISEIRLEPVELFHRLVTELPIVHTLEHPDTTHTLVNNSAAFLKKPERI